MHSILLIPMNIQVPGTVNKCISFLQGSLVWKCCIFNSWCRLSSSQKRFSNNPQQATFLRKKKCLGKKCKYDMFTASFKKT